MTVWAIRTVSAKGTITSAVPCWNNAGKNSYADPANYGYTGSRAVHARIGGVDATVATLPADAGAMPALPFARLVNVVRLTAYGKCLTGTQFAPRPGQTVESRGNVGPYRIHVTRATHLQAAIYNSYRGITNSCTVATSSWPSAA